MEGTDIQQIAEQRKESYDLKQMDKEFGTKTIRDKGYAKIR